MSGIKQKVNPSAKKYCYKNDCEVVETGFNLDVYYVCKVCKEEVTESLKNSIKNRTNYDAPSEDADNPDDSFTQMFFPI